MSGRPDDVLPEWMKVDLAQVPADCQVDYQWLLGLRAELVRRLTEAGWPNPEQVNVYADSAHRVDTRGGWHYFKG